MANLNDMASTCSYIMYLAHWLQLIEVYIETNFENEKY